MADPEGARTVSSSEDDFFGFGPLNLGLFLAGIALIVLGYVFLDRGSVTAAPVLLVLGYAVVLPMAILIRTGREG